MSGASFISDDLVPAEKGLYEFPMYRECIDFYHPGGV